MNNEGQRVSLVIIDTLAGASGAGDENKTADMNTMVRHAAQLAEAQGIHVSIVHHTGKDPSKGGRGSVALRCRADTEIEIQAAHPTDKSKPAKLHVTKQRDMDFIPDIPFRLNQVLVGTTQDMEEVKSAVVEFLPQQVVKVTKSTELTPPLRMAVEGLDAAITAGGLSDASGPEWKEAVERIAGEMWHKDKFNSARTRLVNDNLVEKIGTRWRLSQLVEVV